MKRLKENVLNDIEFLILSGSYSAGEKLPAERVLAEKFNVSRPVVHESLLILESRGLIILRPRHGAVVNDFRRRGTLDLLTSLLCHTEEGLNPEVLESLYRLRSMLETDAAHLAAKNLSPDNLIELRQIILKDIEETDAGALAERDFSIHHIISVFSGNVVYPLIMNTLKPVYIEFLKTFYKRRGNIGAIRSSQYELLKAFEAGDSSKAASIMKELSSFEID